MKNPWMSTWFSDQLLVLRWFLKPSQGIGDQTYPDISDQHSQLMLDNSLRPGPSYDLPNSWICHDLSTFFFQHGNSGIITPLHAHNSQAYSLWNSNKTNWLTLTSTRPQATTEHHHDSYRNQRWILLKKWCWCWPEKKNRESPRRLHFLNHRWIGIIIGVHLRFLGESYRAETLCL